MSQADLVRILDVPISPLREAVQVLESEGLLMVMPRSGIRIVQPDMGHQELVPASAHARAGGRLALRVQRQHSRDRRLGAAPPPIGGGRRRRARRTDPQPPRSRVDESFHDALLRSLRNPIIDEVYLRIRSSSILPAWSARAGRSRRSSSK